MHYDELVMFWLILLFSVYSLLFICEWTKYNLYTQAHHQHSNVPRKQKKKAQATEEEPEVEIITRVKVIYEDTKSITGIDPEYKWREIYRMISNQSVPEAGF